MPLVPSARLGSYEILSSIGAGGMGEVYRARDTKLGRDVAIKVLPDTVAHDAERMARFEREAQVLALLNHPNIAAIYGLEESNDVRALVMELVEGPTLADRIAQGPVPLDEALTLAKQIAEGLEYAHEKGVIHRDLKPANIKVTSDGTVKLLDFGLAKAVEEPVVPGNPSISPTLTMQSTRAGVILGTASYMSPEQASGKPVDRRADIWSFGVVLWEMLCGHKLFDGETVSHTLADVLRGKIDVNKLPAGTPLAIRELVLRCLDRDVKSRLRDVGEARVAIQKYRENPSEAELSGRVITRGSRREVFAWIAAGVLLVALALVYYRHASEEARTVKLFLPPPENASFSGPPAVSPDGRHVAFAATTGEKTQLWVRDLDSLAARPLAGTEGAYNPFWSPDNRFVAFFAGRKLKKIEVAGGPAQTLCDASAGRGGAWSQNGVIVFTPGIFDSLYRVPAAGGSATPLIAIDQSLGEDSIRCPWFLPDGRHFLYTARNSDRYKSAIYVGDLGSKERRRILSAGSNAVYAPPGFVLFLRERTLMAQPFDAGSIQTTGDPFPIADEVDFTNEFGGLFSVSQNGVLAHLSSSDRGNRQLTWFDRGGKPLGTVGTPGYLLTPSISPDGSTVALRRSDPQAATTDIWLHDLARGTASRFTFGPDFNFSPVWSPDGSGILFASSPRGPRGRSFGLYLKPTGGAGKEELLLKTPLGGSPSDWSRDARFVIYDQTGTNAKLGIWVLPLSGDGPPVPGKPFPFLQTEFNEFGAKLSRDSKWLVYTSDETGRNEVYVQTFPSPGGKSQVSTSGGRRPVWSRDGRELFYVGADGKLMAVEVKAASKLEAGAPKPLFDTRLGAGGGFDISPDGRRFLLANSLEEADRTPMTIIVNWNGELKR
jgi:eukaryotic-like serine/threonine-protein kinase